MESDVEKADAIDQAALAQAFAEVVEGRPTGPLKFAEIAVRPLCRHVAMRFKRSVTDESVQDGAADAVFGLIRRPEAYDAARGKTLWGYLKMAAEGDFRNAAAKQERGGGTFLANAVELSEADGNKGDGGTNDPATIVGYQELLAQVEGGLESETDRKVLRLMIEQERRTEVYAEVLGLGHLALETQREQVKNCKDRINKQLRRMGVRWHEGR
jgi:hypothetical protein